MDMAVEFQKLRFNLSKPSEREAWKIVQTIPAGKRNRFIQDAIRAHEQNQAEEEKQEALAERIADLVAERLAEVTTTLAEPTNDPTGPGTDVYEKSMAIAEAFMKSWG